MFLILQVTSANASTLGPAARMVFTRQGGSIGRRAGNDWVLPDAHVSGRHARIRAMGGTFFLEDNESGNGVIVNGSRIHAGEPFPLKDGDVVFIDPFEIVARLSATMPEALGEGLATAGQVPPVIAPIPSPARIPPQAPLPVTGGLDDLFGAGAGGSDEFNALLDTPPAAPVGAIPSGLDLLAKPVLHDSMHLATPSLPPVMTPVAPAQRASGGIPMNWDLTDPEPSPPARALPPVPPVQIPSITQVMAPAAPAFVSPAAPAYAPATPPVMARAASVAQPAVPVTAGGASSDLLEVLRGAGLDVNAIDPQVATQLGQVLRTVVEGLMEVLRARGEIKGEFRLQQTTFKPRENNPLKFSANVEDALHNLLVKRNAAYLNTPAAFEDAFADVRHHQVAMLAGMRAAFDYMLTRFDPGALAAQFDARPGRKLSIGLGSGGRHWDSFGEYYKEMTRDRDDCFRRLFGDQFARAYEEQLQRLRAESHKNQ
jgi:type VI secretion system FHA domain protein